MTGPGGPGWSGWPIPAKPAEILTWSGWSGGPGLLKNFLAATWTPPHPRLLLARVCIITRTARTTQTGKSFCKSFCGTQMVRATPLRAAPTRTTRTRDGRNLTTTGKRRLGNGRGAPRSYRKIERRAAAGVGSTAPRPSPISRWKLDMAASSLPPFAFAAALSGDGDNLALPPRGAGGAPRGGATRARQATDNRGGFDDQQR